MVLNFRRGEKFVERAALVHVCLRLVEQFPRSAGFALLEDLEPLFELEVIREFYARRGGIKLERIFSEPQPLGIVTIQQPLSGIHC